MFDVEEIGAWVIEAEARRDQWRTPESTDDAELHAMVKRRRDFELRLGPSLEDVTSEQRLRAWELAASEPLPERLTADEVRAHLGSARHL